LRLFRGVGLEPAKTQHSQDITNQLDLRGIIRVGGWGDDDFVDEAPGRFPGLSAIRAGQGGLQRRQFSAVDLAQVGRQQRGDCRRNRQQGLQLSASLHELVEAALNVRCADPVSQCVDQVADAFLHILHLPPILTCVALAFCSQLHPGGVELLDKGIDQMRLHKPAGEGRQHFGLQSCPARTGGIATTIHAMGRTRQIILADSRELLAAEAAEHLAAEQAPGTTAFPERPNR
jgi:hypothetical protein